MNENRRNRTALYRPNDRGFGTTAAVLILAAVVMGVGAVSYVVLSEDGHANTTSSSVHSCAPAKSPGCAEHATFGIGPLHVGEPVA